MRETLSLKPASANGALIAIALFASPLVAEAPASDMPLFTPERVEAKVRFLSDDLLEGRDTGSIGDENRGTLCRQPLRRTRPETRRRR